MKKNQLIFLWIVVLIVIIYNVLQTPENDIGYPHTPARDYHDQVLVQNNRLLIQYEDKWESPEKHVWENLLMGVLKGEVLDTETDFIPDQSYPFRLINDGRWDAKCYLDFNTGVVYLNKVMEEKDENLYTSIRLNSTELALLKDRMERNLLKIKVEGGTEK